MKLAIAGSTGYLGQELIKQALSNHRITTVIAISRRETILPSKDHLLPNADPAKLKSVVVEDFMSDWTESSGCEEDLKDLDGMIWTIAVTPGKASLYKFEEVSRISKDYATHGQKLLCELRTASTPLKFVYMSGVAGERDQNKKPWLMGKHVLMRGEAENQILAYATKNPEKCAAMIAKPGLITNSTKDTIGKKLGTFVLGAVGVVPNVELDVISKVLLEQVMRERSGFEKDTLMNDELRILGGQQ